MSDLAEKRTRDVGRAAFKVAAIYALAGGLWILVSDRILFWFIQDAARLAWVQTLKGWFFVLVSAALLAGLVRHYMAILRQEDERQRESEQELSRRTRLLENIIANIPLYVFWKDRDCVYLGCNQRFASVAGVGRPENIVGKTDFDLAWRVEAAETTRRIDQRVMEKRQALLDSEESQRQADGRDATFLASKVPLIAKGGEVIGLIGIYTDITLRKQAEQALRQALAEAEKARSELDGIIASVSDALIVTDLEDRVTLINRAAEELLQTSQEKALGSPLEVVVRDDLLRNRLTELLARKSGDSSLEIQLPGRASQRPRFYQARTSAIRRQEGEVTGLVTILLDTTREHELDRMKTEFIAAATRDFRSPLASIQGFSELLLSADAIGREEQIKFLSYINEEALTLARIVKNHLDIALIESGGELPLEQESCDLAELLDKMVRHFRGRNPQRTLKLDLPASPLEACVDRGRIEQVVSNVLDNAVKYSPENGLIRITGAQDAEGFRLAIADRGRGMPPEELEQVFDKFYRGPVSSRGVEGLGLGLNIARHIVEAHGGRIALESVPEEGTTVTITLPLGREGTGPVKRDEKRERGSFEEDSGS